jgi:amidohydrolase
MSGLLAGLEDRIAGVRELYEDLHRNPELSFQEQRTAGVLAQRLRTAGYEVTSGVGGTGVVGVLRNGDGPGVLLRADMDALPVREVDQVPYRSTAVGVDADGNESPVMHACGHDAHMAALIGAAEQLAARRDAWSGTVLAVCQPAEEVGGGARAMIDDGFLDRFPAFDVALGQHIA